jgi:hypothetical protein
MRKLIVVILLLLTSVTAINATTYTSYFPGGKNYLDSNNFEYGSQIITTINPFKVKSNQTYTLTVPREIEHLYVQVYGDIDYLDDESWQLPECHHEFDRTYCTFTTTSQVEDLTVLISGGYLSEYLEEYGMYRFQLEEGSESTEYEGYIPPNDVSGPTVSGTGTYITTYRDQTPIENIVSNHVTAIDEIEGDVSETIEIITDDYTSNRSSVGHYSVIIQAHDSQNNSTQFRLVVIVKDEFKPIITGSTQLVTNVDSPESITSLLSSHTSFDEYDGNLAIDIDEDNYTSNSDVTGTYNVIISSTDSSDNKEELIISVLVEDTIPPEVTSETTITQYISNPISSITLLSTVMISDNYNVASDITKEIIRDTYSQNNTSRGTYEVDVLLTDKSGNKSTTTITVSVVDDINPVIAGPNSIVLSYKDIQDIGDIKALFTLFDNDTVFNIDDLIVLSDNYSTNGNQLGDYIITFELIDTSLNRVQKTLNITVVDDVGPVLTTDDYIVSVSSEARVTNKDLVNILIKHNKVEDKEYDIEVTLDEYTKNINTPGSYKYQVNLIDEDGNVEHMDFVIKVESSIDLEPSSNNILLLTRNILLYSSIMAMLIVVIVRIKKK